MKSIYLMDKDYLAQLLLNSQELISFARSTTDTNALKVAKEELIAGTRIQLTPQKPDDYEKLYIVDSDGLAHIDIIGELTPVAKTDICGAYTAQALTEYGFIREATRAANKDARVKSIVYHIDSSGGYVDGLDEAAMEIANSYKYTESIVHNKAASAAFWLASQTKKITLASPSALVGSIGVAAEIIDSSEADKQKGIRRLVFTSTDAPNKMSDPTTDEGKAEILKLLDETHKVFIARVADGRGTTVEDVNENYGRGSLVSAQEALRRGMIDEVIGMPKSMLIKKPGVAGFETAATAETNNEEIQHMNLEELKRENPGVYAEAESIGYKKGIEAERMRRNNLDNLAKADPDNKKLRAVIDEAIIQGTEATDPSLSARIQVAIRDGSRLAGENAPDIETESASSGDESAVKACVEKLKKIGG